ncbi:uncharacterized protein LOC121718901 isoform X2 [Alosa sapidissima]|uniref:uncharacterized protein LOC121718901 isoform X2 n=1 Tax=Alosa sapidissima TaxID=34773 RepID=UPI001C0A10F2|nr:uncharacterized protein LOC121718901 isoform X2 [Alosa sapidissima]
MSYPVRFSLAKMDNSGLKPDMSRYPEPSQQQPMPVKKVKSEECYEFLQKVKVEETPGLEHGCKTEILAFQTFIVKEEKWSPVRIKEEEEEEESNLREYGHSDVSPDSQKVEERPELEPDWTTDMPTSPQLTCKEETYCTVEIKEEMKEETYCTIEMKEEMKEEDCHEDVSFTIQEEKPGIEYDCNAEMYTSPQLTCKEEIKADAYVPEEIKEEEIEEENVREYGHGSSPINTRGSIGIDCDPEPKTWSILGSFMAFGSDDLFYSAPNTTLDALAAFPHLAPATAPLSSPAAPEGLAAPALEMRDPCGQKCRRQCTAKFSEERRQEIWSSYRAMDFAEKRMFVFHSVSQLPTARSYGAGSRRGRSFVYRLKDKDRVPQQVCKTFFLATLGYHPTNDSLVLSVMRREIGNVSNLRDQRGRHAPANKLDMQPVYDHIESFHPSVSHCGRVQAPHCRYLPRDITVKLMYADYVEKGNHCSYETYRKAVKQKNISFCKTRGDVRSACWP